MKPVAHFLPIVVSLLLLAACGESERKAPHASGGPLTSRVAPTPETLEKLAAADRLDGTEDKVISLCPSCSLRMAGKADFSCRIGDYTTHSCAAHCNARVCEDPNAVFEDIELPAEEPAPK